MALTTLEEAREQPGMLLEIRGTISADIAADLLKAHNKAFRAWCRENGQRPRDLLIVDSGAGSYWARLRDVLEVVGHLEAGADILPAFITHLAAIVHHGLASDPEDFPPLFLDLLKSYRKAIANKSVQAIVISELIVKSIAITSVQQVDQILATALTPLLPKSPEPPGAPVDLLEEFEGKISPAQRGSRFKRHGAVRVLDRTTYVRLEGMDGALLPAHGVDSKLLKHGSRYAFEGHTLANSAGETIGYLIEHAEPISVLK